MSFLVKMHRAGVGKSAFYSKQKERHSKGERVPFSAYTNFYTNF